MVIFRNDKKFQEYRYTLEDELEKDIINNSKLFFGKDTMYIDAKRKIESKALGGVIPDGFLFDLSDKDSPEFYIVEVELSSHDFFNHIFPQITKFFAFFKNRKSEGELVEKIFSIVNTNLDLKKEFKKYLGEREIYKFIKDIIENSQNILLIIDAEKNELPEIMETYSDTWGKMVKLLILRKFIYNDDIIYTLEPDFENIEYAYAESVKEVDKAEEVEYNEEFHLEGVTKEIKEAYFKIKEDVLKINKDLVFNPTKYYISIVYNKNIAYFKFRKKKIRLVIMLPEEDVKKRINNHKIKDLPESVQKFWNGPSCEIIIESKDNIDELINLLKLLIAGDINEEPEAGPHS